MTLKSIEPDSGATDRLVADILRDTGQPLADARTLPPACYVSPDFFLLEQERIFRSEWIAIGHVAQVPEHGDYASVELLGEPLLIVRDGREIRVMSRVCLHKWAPIVEGSGRASRFSCPFHRWTFDLAGQLVSAPLMDQARDFDRAACRLPQIRHEVVGGTIFATLSNDAPPLAPRLAEWERTVAEYDMANLAIAFSLEIPIACNWKIAVETFMEPYHHIGPHARSLEPSYPAALHWADDSNGTWTAGHGFIRPNLPTPQPAPEGTGFPFFPGLSEERKRRSLCHLIYPNHTLYLSLDRISWVSFIPMAPDRTLWLRHVLVRPEVLEMPGFDAIVARSKADLLAINEEDIAVNLLQQRGARSIFARAGRLSHLEKPVWQLGNYVRDRLGKDLRM